MCNASASGYLVRVGEHLDDRWGAWLGGWQLQRHPDGTTTLTSNDADQAQLHGVLASLRDLSATLLEVSAASRAPGPTLPGPVETARLTLRPGQSDDAEGTWAYRRLPEVGVWLTEIPADLDSYRSTFTRPDRLGTTIIVETGGSIVGDLMLRIEDAWAQTEAPSHLRGTQAELGWVLNPLHTGRGYATEAVQAIIRTCFTTLGVRRVTANCFLADETSWRLMERVGMRREAHAQRESRHRSGQWLDTVTYALLADEYVDNRPGNPTEHACRIDADGE